MSFNVPGYDTSRLSIGPGILYIGPEGSEPTIDVGAVRSGMTIVTTREKVDIYQGIPRSLIETYTVQETGTISINGLEWNIDRLAEALGAGSISSDASNKIFEFGGEITFSKVALKFVHTKPNNKTLTFKLWRGRGSGEFTFTFGDDPHEFPYVFDMLLAATDWDSNPLAIGKQLYKIEEQI